MSVANVYMDAFHMGLRVMLPSIGHMRGYGVESMIINIQLFPSFVRCRG